MLRIALRFTHFLLAVFSLVPVASAQVATGFPPFGSFTGGSFDTINEANLNVHFEIPIFSKAGVGLPFKQYLSYDSSIWTLPGSQWIPDNQWGWRIKNETILGSLGYSLTTSRCNPSLPTPLQYYYSNFVYFDSHGTSHSFLHFSLNDTSQCGGGGTDASGNSTATDGSALYLSANTNNIPSSPWWKRSYSQP